MASQWFCRVLGDEWGPLSFADLAEMLRAGTLSEDDLVRRDGTREWAAARDIVGLLHTARVGAAVAPARAEPEPPAPISAAVAASEMLESYRDEGAGTDGGTGVDPAGAGFSRRGLWWGLGVGAVVLAGVGFFWSSQQAEVFPTPRGSEAATSEGFHLPVIGAVSLAEYVLIWFDLLLAAAALAWVVRRWYLQQSN